MKQFKTGLARVIKGIIGGIALSLILHALKEFNLISSEISYLFTIIVLLSSLITLLSFWKTGVFFTLGWILGAWVLKGILKDIFSDDDYLIYFVAPIVILITRVMLFIRKQV